jgi:hypothetical protein
MSKIDRNSKVQTVDKQLIFIDDSGDPGFQFHRGSSRFFIITAVICNNVEDANRLREKISECKRQLKLSDNYELKFSSTKKKHIKSILTKTVAMPFCIKAVVVDKSTFRIQQLSKPKVSLYNFVIKEFLLHIRAHNPIVVIDGRNQHKYALKVLTYLRKQFNIAHIKYKKIKFLDSKSDLLLQYADLIAGSIHRSYERSKTDQNEYLNIIRKKISKIISLD